MPSRFIVVMAFGALTGCFYTEVINERPSAEIRRDGSGEVLRGAEVSFLAVLDDPDDDSLSISWHAQACNLRSVCASVVSGVDPFLEFRVPGEVEGAPTVRVAVYLDVTDTHGAVARPTQMLELPVGNNAPTVLLQRRGRELDGQFPPGVPIVITAGVADPDEDSVTLTWELFPARASESSARGWRRLPDPPPSPVAEIVEAYELIPDVDGEWVVRVTATDGIDTAVESRTLVVEPDRAPCIGATDPPAATGALLLDGRRRISVLAVDDDLDVYPFPPPSDLYLGPATFSWSVRAAGATEFSTVATGVSALEVDPAFHAPGDRIEVRVEIGDRTGRAVDCETEAPTCSERQDECLQRQTWTMEVR